MKVRHQGWNDLVGTFHCDVTVDTNKTDYEIFFPNGRTSRQQTPFEEYTADWDQTGSPYPKIGAFFSCDGNNEFFTPLELASLSLNGYADIPGLQIEYLQPALEDRIRSATQRSKIIADIHRQKQNHSDDRSTPTLS